MSIFPSLTSEQAQAERAEAEVANLVNKWGPVMRKCRELDGRPAEDIRRFVQMCEDEFEECDGRGDISRFTRVILPNIRRLFGATLPLGTPLLRTVEEEREFLRPQIQSQQIIQIAAGLGHRKLDLESVFEADYQI